MRELDFFIGSWTATGTRYHPPFCHDRGIAMTLSTWSVEKGLWYQFLAYEQPSPANRYPLRSHHLWGYDAASGRYLAHRFDSYGNHTSLRSSGWDGQTLIFQGYVEGRHTCLPIRDTYTCSDSDRYVHTTEVHLATGWDTVEDVHLTRRPPTRLPRIYTGRLPNRPTGPRPPRGSVEPGPFSDGTYWRSWPAGFVGPLPND